MINKSKINIYKGKKYCGKTCNKEKKDYLCCKKKRRIIIFERNFIIYRLRPAFIEQDSMKKRMFTITITSNF